MANAASLSPKPSSPWLGTGASLALALGLFVLLAAWPAQARPPLNAAQLGARLKTIEPALEARDWAQVEKAAAKLLADAIEIGVGDPGTPASLARLLALLAVAEAELDLPDDALWHWQVAQQVAPATAAEVAPASYGPKAAMLAGQTPRTPVIEPEPPSAMTELRPVEAITAGTINRPKRIEGALPRFPDGQLRQRHGGKVLVEVVIGQDGRPRDPAVIRWTSFGTPRGQEHLLILASLESFRKWRFAPATLNGSPVKVYYTLTANYAFN